jgi:hypothetical protein
VWPTGVAPGNKLTIERTATTLALLQSIDEWLGLCGEGTKQPHSLSASQLLNDWLIHSFIHSFIHSLIRPAIRGSSTQVPLACCCSPARRLNAQSSDGLVVAPSALKRGHSSQHFSDPFDPKVPSPNEQTQTTIRHLGRVLCIGF